jgi:hypothetical protein
MADLTILTFWWGDKYSPGYVARLASGLRRHLHQPYRFVCVHGRGMVPPPDVETAPLADPGLCTIPGCFARLRTFSPDWQRQHDIAAGSRIVCLDLDLIVTGPLDPLFDRDEDFVIWQHANVSNPCPYNASVTMLRACAHAEVWSRFSPDAARRAKFFSFPDDQGWLWHTIPDAAGWECGAASGIWAFGKRAWPKDNKLPDDARIVAFPGARDPLHYVDLEWVQQHWLVDA